MFYSHLLYLNLHTQFVYLNLPNPPGISFHLIKGIIFETIGRTIAQFEFPDYSSKIGVLQKAALLWSYCMHFWSNTLKST